MQEIAAERREGRVSHTQLGSGSVKGVAYHGMFQRGKMDAYLVGASGVKLDLQQSGGVDAKQGSPVGARFAQVGNFSGGLWRRARSSALRPCVRA